MHSANELIWTDAEIAWMAGLFEGEGSFSFRGKSAGAATVKMTDEDVVQRLHEIARCGSVYGPYPSSVGHKPYWEWTVTRVGELRPFLDAIQPWMGRRRASRLAEVRERIASNRGSRALLTECPLGHPYEQRYAAGKTRICKECHRARNRRLHAAKVAAQAAERGMA